MIRAGYSRVALVVLAASLAALLALATLSETSGAQEDQTTTNETKGGARYITGELLVTLKDQAPNNAVSALGNRARVDTKPVVPDLGIELLKFPQIKVKDTEQSQEQSLEEAKRKLEKDPLVKDVGYNYLVYPRFTPNDKLYSRQYAPRKIQAPQAWISTLGKGVRIGVIDTGIQANHPDLAGKVVAQRDFYSGDGTAEDGKAEDTIGHGTQVSGIAAADMNNRRGIASICPDCKLVVGKFIGPRGGTIADSLKAINFAVDHGAKVLNLSYGYVGPNSPQEKVVINRAWNRGVFLAAAVYEGYPAGYYGKQDDWPSAYKNVMAVSATDRNDKRAPFANHGAYIDITAPGVDILSTNNFGSYDYNYGTSFAVPHVTGVAGLLASEGLSNKEITNRIESSAVDLGKKGKDPYYGYGRIDALAAVGSATPKPRHCTIKGTRGTDILHGTARSDIICGLGSNDIISGGGGNDTIYGDGGDDILNGGSGSDLIIGGSGKDVMNGGTGLDRLHGGGGSDVLNISDGRDGDLADGGADRDVCSADQKDKVVRCP